MPNKNHIQNKEIKHKAIEELEEQGYTVFSLPESKIPVDIIGADLNHIRFIKLKSVKGLTGGRKYVWSEVKELTELMVPSGCRKEIWIYNLSKNNWIKEVLF